MFFLGEYAHMITSSAFMVTLFFGGYLLPDFLPGSGWVNESTTVLAMLARIGVISLKITLFIVLYMLVRWTLPRFRYDQLMGLAWKSLVPMGLILVLMQIMIVYKDWPQWYALVGNAALLALMAVWGAGIAKPITGRQKSMLKNQRVQREAQGMPAVSLQRGA